MGKETSGRDLEVGSRTHGLVVVHLVQDDLVFDDLPVLSRLHASALGALLDQGRGPPHISRLLLGEGLTGLVADPGLEEARGSALGLRDGLSACCKEQLAADRIGDQSHPERLCGQNIHRVPEQRENTDEKEEQSGDPRVRHVQRELLSVCSRAAREACRRRQCEGRGALRSRSR